MGAAHRPGEMCVVGKTQIGGHSGQVVLALHQPFEGQLDAQRSSELCQNVSGLLTEKPAEMVRGAPEHPGQVDDPRDRGVGHQRSSRFVRQTTPRSSARTPGSPTPRLGLGERRNEQREGGFLNGQRVGIWSPAQGEQTPM